MKEQALTIEQLKSLPSGYPLLIKRPLTTKELSELSVIGDYSDELSIMEGEIAQGPKKDQAIVANKLYIPFSSFEEMGLKVFSGEFKPSHLEVSSYDAGDGIRIERIAQQQGVFAWIIRSNSYMVLNKAGDWDFEPMASNRSRDYLGSTRFKDVKDAFAVLQKERAGYYEMLRDVDVERRFKI